MMNDGKRTRGDSRVLGSATNAAAANRINHSGNNRRPVFEQTPAQMQWQGAPDKGRNRLRPDGKRDKCRRLGGNRQRLVEGARLEIGTQTVVVRIVRSRVKTLMQLQRGGKQGQHENLDDRKPHQGRENAHPSAMAGIFPHRQATLPHARRIASGFIRGRYLLSRCEARRKEAPPASGLIVIAAPWRRAECPRHGRPGMSPNTVHLAGGQASPPVWADGLPACRFRGGQAGRAVFPNRWDARFPGETCQGNCIGYFARSHLLSKNMRCRTPRRRVGHNAMAVAAAAPENTDSSPTHSNECAYVAHVRNQSLYFNIFRLTPLRTGGVSGPGKATGIPISWCGGSCDGAGRRRGQRAELSVVGCPLSVVGWGAWDRPRHRACHSNPRCRRSLPADRRWRCLTKNPVRLREERALAQAPVPDVSFAVERDLAGLAFHADHCLALSKAASKAMLLDGKSTLRTNEEASAAPCTRSMRMSSHSTESGPR